MIALRPNQHVREARNAHFVATVVNVPTGRIIGEVRKGHGLYVQGKAALPNLREAADFAQKRNGHQASELREQMSRNYGLASVARRLLFESGRVNLVQRDQVRKALGVGSSKNRLAQPTTRWLYLPKVVQVAKGASGKVLPE